MKKALTIIVIAASATAFANGHEKKAEMKAKFAAHKQEVNHACSEDAKAAGCEGKEVGEGLLKCIFAHKKAHKDFKISDSCKAATKDLRDEKNAAKAEKAAEKADK